MEYAGTGENGEFKSLSEVKDEGQRQCNHKKKTNFFFHLCPFHSYSSRIVSSGFQAKEPTCGIYLGILSLARSRKVLSGWSMSDQL